MKKIIVLSLLMSGLNSASAQTYVNWDFNQDNAIYTSILNNTAEPTEPTSEQLGPKFVAKGKPFYSPNSKGIDGKIPQVGWTVAPGSQYQIGFESSCTRIPQTKDCIRDNAISVEVYGDSNTKENGIFQDKAMLQLFDVKVTPPNYFTPNIVSAPHMLHFDMKFDRFYEVGKSPTMHVQSFQPECGPAMAMKVEKWNLAGKAVDAPIKIIFELLKDDLASTGFKPTKINACPQIQVSRNEWKKFLIQLVPGAGVDSAGKRIGLLTVSLNDQVVCEFTGNWGMTISQSGGSCNQGHRIDIGTYGGRNIERRKVYFDNVRYGRESDLIKFGKSRLNILPPYLPPISNTYGL